MQIPQYKRPSWHTEVHAVLFNRSLARDCVCSESRSDSHRYAHGWSRCSGEGWWGGGTGSGERCLFGERSIKAGCSTHGKAGHMVLVTHSSALCWPLCLQQHLMGAKRDGMGQDGIGWDRMDGVTSQATAHQRDNGQPFFPGSCIAEGFSCSSLAYEVSFPL